MLIVDPAALILLVEPGLGGFALPLAVELYDPLGPEGAVGGQIHVQGIGTILQDVVGVSAYDDAGALLRQLQDHVALGIP